MARVIVGTAGHIDHGKSALVRALTGVDPDRLPEEKQRGITIDLGFAFLDDVAAMIDVPGHEKFIRNMVAGAATIDFALMVIAADDGVMPQTREHLQILQLLGIRRGAVVLTKIDVVEASWLELVEEQVRTTTRGTFLENAPLFHVDSISGRGIAEFRSALIAELLQLTPRSGQGVYRQPIDRVFTVKGRGTVVTGTVVSGEISCESTVSLYPGKREFRVKQIESRSAEVLTAMAGMRAALNLLGPTETVERGMTVSVPGSLCETTRVLVKIERIEGSDKIKDRQRVRLLIGTQEVIGRCQWVGELSPIRFFAILLLESAIVAAWHDHFILRRYSPMETLGGGVVLDPEPPLFRAKTQEIEQATARVLDTENAPEALIAYVMHRERYGSDLAMLARNFAMPIDAVHAIVAAAPSLVRIDKLAFDLKRVLELETTILSVLQRELAISTTHVGIPAAVLREKSFHDMPAGIFDLLLNRLIESNKIKRNAGQLTLQDSRVQLSPEQEKRITAIRKILSNAGFAPPSPDVIAEQTSANKNETLRLLALMVKLHQCTRLGVDLYFDTENFDRAVQTISKVLLESRELTVADTAKLLNSSRKFVVPLLEFLDQQGITSREGNVRVRGRNFTTPIA